MKAAKRNVTYLPEKEKLVRKWWLIDADGVVVGKLASKISLLLRGKGHPYFTPFFDCGDFVVVINASKVKVTGRKDEQKIYYRHSGYMGGLREISYQRLLAAHPERIVLQAVKGMLPRNRLCRKMLTKLKVYAGPEHKHAAQQPQPLKI